MEVKKVIGSAQIGFDIEFMINGSILQETIKSVSRKIARYEVRDTILEGMFEMNLD